jgi:CRISPR-associated protein Csm3
MFQTLQNTAKIEFRIVPDGPLLVRAQSVGLDPGVADMEFQRTHRNGQSTVFLAGSGLKGVLRSHAERLLRSASHFACDPTQTRDNAMCGRRKKDSPFDAQYPHGNQCPACFTFGSLMLAGRFRIGDAYPSDELVEVTNRTEVRTGVGIDRKSQAASQGVLYDSEVVVSGAFDARIQGENYSLWQLGLLLASLQDLGSGLIRIGGCKARGMGTVRLEGWRVELGFLDRETGKITGARPHESGKNPYSLPKVDVVAAPEGGKAGRQGLFRLLHYEEDQVPRLIDSLVGGPLQSYMERRA